MSTLDHNQEKNGGDLVDQSKIAHSLLDLSSNGIGDGHGEQKLDNNAEKKTIESKSLHIQPDLSSPKNSDPMVNGGKNETNIEINSKSEPFIEEEITVIKKEEDNLTEQDEDIDVSDEWNLPIDISSEGPYLTLNEYNAIYEKILYDIKLSVQVLRKYKSGTSEVYGEALPELVDFLKDNLGIQSSDVVYDIGSGIGNVVLQLSAQTGCKCYGVEIREDLHEIGMSIHSHLKEEMKRNNKNGLGEVVLINGDALTQPTILVDTTVVFLNNVCYPEKMLHKLEHFFMETLQHGTRVVTVKELFPRARPSSGERFGKSFATLFEYPCKQFTTGPGVVSWKAGGVTLNVYTVDRNMFEKYRSFPKKRQPIVPVKVPIKTYDPLANLVGEIKLSKKIDEYLATLHHNSNLCSLVLLKDSTSGKDVNNINDSDPITTEDVPLFSVARKSKQIASLMYQAIDRKYRDEVKEIAKKSKEIKDRKRNNLTNVVTQLLTSEKEIQTSEESIVEYQKKIEEFKARIQQIKSEQQRLVVDLRKAKSEFTEKQLSNIVPNFNFQKYLEGTETLTEELPGTNLKKRKNKGVPPSQEKMDIEDHDYEDLAYLTENKKKPKKEREMPLKKRTTKGGNMNLKVASDEKATASVIQNFVKR